MSKYAEPLGSALSGLKRELEEEESHRNRLPEAGTALSRAGGHRTAVFEIFIKTTPERLWEAITDPEMRARYSFGVGTESDWTRGLRATRSGVPGVIDIAEGENLEVDPPRRLVQTFTALWSDEVKAAGASRVTWEIEPVGDDSCRLTVVHDQLPGRERRALRRLDDDPLRPQDAARDGRAPDHAGVPALLAAAGS